MDEGFVNGMKAEQICLTLKFCQFQEHFPTIFTLKMDGQEVKPKDALFDPLLIHLLVTILKYKKRKGTSFDRRISVVALTRGFKAYLQQYYSHLLEQFTTEQFKDWKSIPYLEHFKCSKPFKVVYKEHNSSGVSSFFGNFVVISV